MGLSSNDLMKQATKQSGFSDFGDDWFLGPLAAWTSDLEGSHLSEKGRAFLARLATNDLIRRLNIIDCLKRNPEVEEMPIPPILYITGHERSGTTLLHNLLSLHRNARYLSRWELMAPTPPPEAATFTEDPRRETVQESLDALKGSDLESMHWVDADDPEECIWGFMDCTGLLGMAPSVIMPGWYEWIMSNDLTPTFRSYRKIIQILTWKNPVPDGGFLVLKAPQIAFHLSRFARVFPETTFVFTHRDPYRVLTSLCTLVDIVNRPFLADKDYFLNQEKESAKLFRRMVKAFSQMRRFEDDHPDAVINVRYGDLLSEPAEVTLGVVQKANLEEDSDLRVKVQAFLDRQKEGKRAKPRKEISTFGYEHDTVLNDPPVAEYARRYGLEAETIRQTGTA